MDHGERKRKREARSVHKNAAKARDLRGIKAKLYNKKRHSEKIQMQKTYISDLSLRSYITFL